MSREEARRGREREAMVVDAEEAEHECERSKEAEARSAARRSCAGERPPVPRSRMRWARPLPVPMTPGNAGPGSAVPEEGYRRAGGGSGCAWGAAAWSGQVTAARKRRRPGERGARPWRRDGLGAAPGGWRRLKGGGWRGEEKKNYSGSVTMLNGKNPNSRIGLGSVLIDQKTGSGPLQETGI
jgi:hypothetical protein